jgi:phosphoglycerate dehydrogenase-like enzyme
MSTFRVGVTHDFLDPQGRLTYRNIGLGLLEGAPGVEYSFLAPATAGTMTPAVHAGCGAVLSLTPAWNADSFTPDPGDLLLVARFGVGYDMCDIAAFNEAGVLLTISRGATDEPVAAGVLAMLLALTHRLPIKDRLVREGRWHERAHYQGSEIFGKTLGIVGLGGAGRALARLVAPFRMRVLACDPFLRPADAAAHGAQLVEDLGELFAQADYVSVHCALNESTRGLIRAEHFARMKPEALFFNAARGPVVVEADLIEALRSGHLAGAGLDVFEQEPPAPDNPLLAMENVLLTPHAVCWTHEGFQGVGETACRSILQLARGEQPFGLVNPEAWEHPRFRERLRRVLGRA